jgi:tRNA(Ile)-lysidine synthase
MPDNHTTAIDTQVAAEVVRHNMLAGVRRLGVAVSGGSDSVALLRLLVPVCRAAGITPVVLHLNHGLRGAAAAADATFVSRLAKRLRLACHMGSAGRATRRLEDEGRGGRTIPGSGAENPPPSTLHPSPDTFRLTPATQSLEMSARATRQAFFRAAARQEKLDAIATGHTADDVAETLLLRLARGSGAAGLSGLRPVHAVAGVRYVRPLLGCTHGELLAWLRARRQAWREDASNRDERIPRNRLRHAVIPWLEQNWSPSIRAMLVQSASILRDEDALLEELSAACGVRQAEPGVQNAACGLRMPRSAVPVALQRRILRQWLLAAGHPEAAGWDEVEAIRTRLGAREAWQVSLSGGVRVQGRDGRLWLVDAASASKAGLAAARRYVRVTREDAVELPVPGVVDVAGVRVMARLGRGFVKTRGPAGVLPSACSLDAQALQGKKLLVRTRRPGDRIRSLGLDGSKTLQDLFVDAKVPAEQRDQLPLLVVDNEVVWVPGYRVAKQVAVRGPRAAAVRVKMQVLGLQAHDPGSLRRNGCEVLTKTPGDLLRLRSRRARDPDAQCSVSPAARILTPVAACRT